MTPHTVLIAVHIAAGGADLDALLTAIEAVPGVQKAEDIATFDRTDKIRNVTVDVLLPTK